MRKMDVFATRLVEIREGKRITQNVLAELVGLKETTYQNYEYGSVKPPVVKLAKIAEVLQVSLDYLCGRSDYLVEEHLQFPKNLYFSFSTALKTERKKKYLTQREVAENIGLKEGSYRAYETRQSLPSYKIFLQLADFYEISLDKLLGRGE